MLTLGSLWTLGGTLSSGAVHAFIHSPMLHSLIHSSGPYAVMLALWPADTAGHCGRQSCLSKLERLPSSCGVSLQTWLGTLLQRPLIKAAPFCQTQGHLSLPGGEALEQPLISLAARKALQASAGGSQSMGQARPRPQGRDRRGVPRQETPGAAFQRLGLPRPVLVGLQSRPVPPPIQKNIGQTALCQPLCSATPPAQQPLG